jgi:transposase InsO family protein
VLEQGVTLKLAAASFNVSARTAAKWVRRYRELGSAGLGDRSSRPQRCPRSTSSPLIEKVLALRRLRYNGWRIAQALGLSRATVCRILRRAGMNRLRSLDPPPPVVRYEHKHPGDLIHFDIKRLARIVKPGHRVHGDYTRKTVGAGYEYLHIAIDDHSRIAFAAILPDQSHQSAIRFFFMTRAFYSRFGFQIKRVLTDNGPCYRDKTFRTLLFQQRIQHRFTRPYTPRTNGKAERFIQTALREWAYARTYQNSDQRHAQLEPWLHDYNFHRQHASLNHNTPASRAGLNQNNLLSLHS